MKKFTLDEAIEHAEEVARRNERKAKYARNHGGYFYLAEAKSCDKCAEEHRQLAEWLKDYREMLNNVENEPLTWDDLKRMEGMPIWVEGQTHKHWCIIKRVFYDDLLGKDFISLMFCNSKGKNDSYQRKESNLGKTWNAYRRERYEYIGRSN